ncbi:MAG: DUF1800 domain-containing protein [Pseudomonadota bacterium]
MFDPYLAETRFGLGLRPGLEPPRGLSVMLGRLSGPDRAAERFPIDLFENYREKLVSDGHIGRVALTRTAAQRQAANRAVRKIARRDQLRWLRAILARRLETQDGFRERLTHFWADHFTAIGKTSVLRQMHAPYVEEAIRPRLTGRFRDMLSAVVRHPMMLAYLDQMRSVGPNSLAAQRSSRLNGLNENLARELLELHTLGVGGPYDQNDVRQLAELLTGLSYSPENGFSFRRGMAEPGPETILGKRYGGGRAQLSDIEDALEDLAAHPTTARHLARKLAVHFIGEAADPGMIEAMALAYLQQDGRLEALYVAMLSHPAAWRVAAPGNVRPPLDFVIASLRALNIRAEQIDVIRPRDVLNGFVRPLALMGMTWERPPGPDGWPENDNEWITPQRHAARVQWAMSVPEKLADPMPDPRQFLQTALARPASDALVFAAAAAESRAAGVGIILSSPEFQRV